MDSPAFISNLNTMACTWILQHSYQTLNIMTCSDVHGFSSILIKPEYHGMYMDSPAFLSNTEYHDIYIDSPAFSSNTDYHDMYVDSPAFLSNTEYHDM